MATNGDKVMDKRTGERSEGVRLLVPAGMAERYVQVQGLRMRYLAGGKGPAVMFLHGMLGFSFSWSENLGSFTEAFSVYAIDFLNLGFSERGESDCSLRGHVEQVIAFMDAVGIERAAVVGSSHGATIALLLAEMHPARVNAVVAVSPPVPWTETRRWTIALFSSWLGSRLAPAMRYSPRAANHFAIARIYGEKRRMRPGTVDGYRMMFRITGTIAHWLRMARSWRKDFAAIAPDTFQHISSPVLIVWGDRDKVVPLTAGERLHKMMPGSELLVIKTAGHLPYEELPDEFNQRVGGWLRRILAQEGEALNG